MWQGLVIVLEYTIPTVPRLSASRRCHCDRDSLGDTRSSCPRESVASRVGCDRCGRRPLLPAANSHADTLTFSSSRSDTQGSATLNESHMMSLCPRTGVSRGQSSTREDTKGRGGEERRSGGQRAAIHNSTPQPPSHYTHCLPSTITTTPPSPLPLPSPPPRPSLLCACVAAVGGVWAPCAARLLVFAFYRTAKIRIAVIRCPANQSALPGGISGSKRPFVTPGWGHDAGSETVRGSTRVSGGAAPPPAPRQQAGANQKIRAEGGCRVAPDGEL